MTDRPSPNWQPITALPLVTDLIDGTLDDARSQLDNLTKARHRSHVLDDALVNLVIRSYSKQAEFLPVYVEQLERWEQLDLTANQRQGVERLKTQGAALRDVLAHELKTGTIDTILNNSDVDVALGFLLGKRRL